MKRMQFRNFSLISLIRDNLEIFRIELWITYIIRILIKWSFSPNLKNNSFVIGRLIWSPLYKTCTLLLIYNFIEEKQWKKRRTYIGREYLLLFNEFLMSLIFTWIFHNCSILRTENNWIVMNEVRSIWPLFLFYFKITHDCNSMRVILSVFTVEALARHFSKRRKSFSSRQVSRSSWKIHTSTFTLDSNVFYRLKTICGRKRPSTQSLFEVLSIQVPFNVFWLEKNVLSILVLFNHFIAFNKSRKKNQSIKK